MDPSPADMPVKPRTYSGDIAALRSRSQALCDRNPLYPGFRGYCTYEA